MSSDALTAQVTAEGPGPADAAARKSRRHWRLRPPGVLFYLGVAFAVFEAIWVSSIQSFVGLMGSQLLWFSLAGIWGLRFAGAVVVARLRFSLAEWLRWLGVPLILGIVYLWTQTGAPFDLRLSLSRSAMDEAAAEVIAGGSTDRQWIGLWPVEDVERIPGGMRFIVMSGGFIDRWGFAYSETGGRPAIMDGEDGYEGLDGDWFIWTDGF